MSARTNRVGRSLGSDARSAQGEPARSKPTERAFVVQFDPITGARSRLRGRAELVESGEVARFRSLKQLVAFMVGILRERPGTETAP